MRVQKWNGNRRKILDGLTSKDRHPIGQECETYIWLISNLANGLSQGIFYFTTDDVHPASGYEITNVIGAIFGESVGGWAPDSHNKLIFLRSSKRSGGGYSKLGA